MHSHCMMSLLLNTNQFSIHKMFAKKSYKQLVEVVSLDNC